MANFQVNTIKVLEVLHKIVNLIKTQMTRDQDISPATSYETLNHMIRLKLKDDAAMEKYLEELVFLLKKPRSRFEIESQMKNTDSTDSM